jgi:regulator of sirC expression with transglutaminase-like and TPR domain
VIPDRDALENDLRVLAELPDDDIRIGRAALTLAALDRPRVALDRYVEHLDRIAAVAGAANAGSLEGRIAALKALFFEELGYAGDSLTYDDVQNANLMRVIDRRKGLPVALGILFLHAAEAAGWSMVGLTFPFHFLVRLDVAGERVALDPFNGGTRVDSGAMRAMLKRFSGDIDLKPEFYQPASKREVLVRLQNNIKSRAMQNNDLPRAAEVLRRTLMFAPVSPYSWRELANIEGNCGNLRDAIAAAEAYRALAPNDVMRHEAAQFLQNLKSRLN